MTMLLSDMGQPDILEVIADLSNDEVFTPPRVANAVLDLLPEHVWSDPNLRWLDPGCKTGVFLREAAKRLMVGLADAFPDEQERLEHILLNMMYGIAVTNLTALMSRRTVYCSKDAAGQHSTVPMPTSAGHIWMERVKHTYVDGRCSECGASEEMMEREHRENYAYAFIHEAGRTAMKEEHGMKFDVIVGNPPYQMDDEGGHRPVPIYHRFVEQAMAMQPRYIAMITPSRWMAGGLGLSQYRAALLQDKRLRKVVDFPVPSEVFPGVEVKGGVSYFLWDRDNAGLCSTTVQRGTEVVGPAERDLSQYDIFIRDSRALPILEKVLAKGVPDFPKLVSSVRPFGDALRSNFTGYRPRGEKQSGDLKLYMNRSSSRVEEWVSADKVTNNKQYVSAWKILLPKAGSDGGQKLPDSVLGPAFIAGPGSVCTETYLAIGPFTSKKQAESALSFLRTRFVRFLISLRKIGQDTIQKHFTWVPLVTWNETWTDEKLYKKYKITKAEQAYIADMVKEMPA